MSTSSSPTGFTSWFKVEMEKLPTEIGVELDASVIGIPMSFYVKTSKRLVENQIVSTLEVLDIVVEEKHRGQGVFTTSLECWKEWCKENNSTLIIDVILNDRLLEALQNRGFTLFSSLPLPTLYLKPTLDAFTNDI